MKRPKKTLVPAAQTVGTLEETGLPDVAGGAASLDSPCQTSNGPLRCFCPNG